MAERIPCPRCGRLHPRLPLPPEWGEDIARKWREMEDTLFLCSVCAREVDRFVTTAFGRTAES